MNPTLTDPTTGEHIDPATVTPGQHVIVTYHGRGDDIFTYPADVMTVTPTRRNITMYLSLHMGDDNTAEYRFVFTR